MFPANDNVAFSRTARYGASLNLASSILTKLVIVATASWGLTLYSTKTHQPDGFYTPNARAQLQQLVREVGPKPTKKRRV